MGPLYPEDVTLLMQLQDMVTKLSPLARKDNEDKKGGNEQ
jgi:hypothetical protein